MDDIVVLERVVKDFGKTRALDQVSFSIRKAEIHGLVGENGAGKSTLAKILSGGISCDSGSFFFNGKRVVGLSPSRAREAGIAIVHQWGDLAWNLSVVENVFLGDEIRRFGVWLDRQEMRRRATEILDHFGVDLNVELPVGKLSSAHKQIVSIAKALAYRSSLLIMDEGGVSLDREDTENLAKIVRQLRDEGVTILYISHLLDNVLSLCDRVTIMRNGKYVDTVEAHATDVEALAALMVGHHVSKTRRSLSSVSSSKPSALRVESLGWDGAGNSYSFEVRAGETVGITGPAGSGKSELLRTIMGLLPKRSGSVFLDGKKLEGSTPRRMIHAGVAFVPEDRMAEGLLMPRSIEENISLPNLWRRRRLLLRERVLGDKAESVSKLLSLKKPSLRHSVSALSGGNQQKVVVGKWLQATSRLYLFDEPYKGIDIGAKEDINRVITELAAHGAATIVVSTEFNDIIDLVDRLFVMVNRKIVAELYGDDINSQNIVRYYQAVVR